MRLWILWLCTPDESWNMSLTEGNQTRVCGVWAAKTQPFIVMRTQCSVLFSFSHVIPNRCIKIFTHIKTVLKTYKVGGGHGGTERETKKKCSVKNNKSVGEEKRKGLLQRTLGREERLFSIFLFFFFFKNIVCVQHTQTFTRAHTVPEEKRG